jgi:hypothetical protein
MILPGFGFLLYETINHFEMSFKQLDPQWGHPKWCAKHRHTA